MEASLVFSVTAWFAAETSTNSILPAASVAFCVRVMPTLRAILSTFTLAKPSWLKTAV